ncbi:Dam family site-specific DNA-(adenine-N6)-methyltransferase [Candidatus Tisiphia endosymbiont of Parasteatoda lunata]|uniref:DNA adenine methylase n=1 Tax=Candidatus Tisiphia endosymbiont of Parasteatoda lunata TaxID=3066275 RepID=UPI00313ABFE1
MRHSCRNIKLCTCSAEWLTNDNDIEVAGRFIYLNKTCYNGLYRVNNKGEFNVPMGKYKNPAIVDETNILACSKLLQNVDIKYQDFSKISPNTGDFVYIDPPYHPINNTLFTKYTKLDFTETDQIKLYQKCKELNDKGIYETGLIFQDKFFTNFVSHFT